MKKKVFPIHLIVQYSFTESLRNANQAKCILWRSSAPHSMFPVWLSSAWCWLVPGWCTQPTISFLSLAYVPRSDFFFHLWADTASIHSSESAIATLAHPHLHPHPPFLFSGILVFPGNTNKFFIWYKWKIRKGLNLLSNIVYNFK